MPMARAFLSAPDLQLKLPVNPYSAQWAYQENTSSFDTLGGRVVQLLSVHISGLTLTSVAGGRAQLQEVADRAKSFMEYHIRTSLPARLVVPSRAWRFSVYLTGVPQVGWDVASTAYPYQLQFAVVDDLDGVKTKEITQTALSRLADGIGYNPALHGGNSAAFTDLVDSVLKLAPTVAGPSSNPVPADGSKGTDSQWQGNPLWSPKVANAPWTGSSIQDQIRNCWQAVYGSKTASDALCICQHESGFNPRANNSYTSTTGTHYVYGLFQISDVHSASPWFPDSGVHGTEGGLLYDAEYNTRSAMQIYSSSGWEPWSTRGSCGV